MFMVLLLTLCGNAIAVLDELEHVYLPSYDSVITSYNVPLRSVLQMPPLAYNGIPSSPDYLLKNSESPNAKILKYVNENGGLGSYNFEYETDNFISQREEGQLITVNGINSIAVRGVYSYIAPNGQLIKTEYVADENGFRAFGDHLPKSFFI